MEFSCIVAEYVREEVKEQMEKKYGRAIAKEKLLRQQCETLVANVTAEALQRADDAAYSYINDKLHDIFRCVETTSAYRDPDRKLVGWKFRPLRVREHDVDTNAPLFDTEKRMKEETDKTMRKIIAELELGGNKSDLDRMLDEI